MLGYLSIQLNSLLVTHYYCYAKGYVGRENVLRISKHNAYKNLTITFFYI